MRRLRNRMELRSRRRTMRLRHRRPVLLTLTRTSQLHPRRRLTTELHTPRTVNDDQTQPHLRRLRTNRTQRTRLTPLLLTAQRHGRTQQLRETHAQHARQRQWAPQAGTTRPSTRRRNPVCTMRRPRRQNPHHDPRRTRPTMQGERMHRMHPPPIPGRSRRGHTPIKRGLTLRPGQHPPHAPNMQCKKRNAHHRRVPCTTKPATGAQENNQPHPMVNAGRPKAA